MAFESLSKSKVRGGPGPFLGYLVQFRTNVKLAHWAQPDKTDATHAALDEIYDDLDGLIDSLVEKYQGIRGIVPIEVGEACMEMPPLQLVESAYAYIEQNRRIFSESFLQNIIDEIQAVIAKGLYKLKFVKSRA